MTVMLEHGEAKKAVIKMLKNIHRRILVVPNLLPLKAWHNNVSVCNWKTDDSWKLRKSAEPNPLFNTVSRWDGELWGENVQIQNFTDYL